MRQKVLGFSLGVMLAALCWPGLAQQAGKVARIGLLGNAMGDSRETAFLDGLRNYGWVEGQNLLIERRYWENSRERLSTFVDELVRFKPDALVTTSGTAALAAKKATSTISIVMTTSGDAVTQGLVASLARPGGNVTGLTNISNDLAGKQLEMLKEAFPKVSRVAALYCPAAGGLAYDQRFSEMRATAQALKVHLQSVQVRGPEEIEGALRAATRERADGLFLHDCSVFPTKIAHSVAKTKLPAIYPTSRFAEAGALMVYGPSGMDLARRAATYVDKILKDAKPADLPVEQPMKFEFVVNLKTAKQIGLTIPPNVLARADRVIR